MSVNHVTADAVCTQASQFLLASPLNAATNPLMHNAGPAFAGKQMAQMTDS